MEGYTFYKFILCDFAYVIGLDIHFLNIKKYYCRDNNGYRHDTLKR
jgi:hypothetical protein